MKTIRKALTILLSVLFMTGMSLPAYAENGSYETSYTVRVYSGAQGTLSGNAVTVLNSGGALNTAASVSVAGDLITITGLKYGDKVILSRAGVTLSNGSKYYVRGFREGGKDNNVSLPSPYITVTEDADYVAAYGLLGSDVTYTVRYLDTVGNRLLNDEVYHGNVGDAPVVAFQYVAGYVPSAYTMSAVLSADPDENVFTFVYYTEEEYRKKQDELNPTSSSEEDTSASDETTSESESDEDDEDDDEDEDDDDDDDDDDEDEDDKNKKDKTTEAAAQSTAPVIDQTTNGADQNGNGDGQNGGNASDVTESAEASIDEETIDGNQNPLGKFFGDVGEAISDAAETVGKTIQEAAVTVNKMPLAGKVGIIAGGVLAAGCIVLLILLLAVKKKKKKDEEKHE